MKKAVFGLSIVAALCSTTLTYADEFSGMRLGVGASQTSVQVEDGDSTIFDGRLGRGVKAEIGYDYNRIVGFGLSYENDLEADDIDDIEIERSTVKAGFDVGYAFYSEEAFLKPYAKVGAVFYTEDKDYQKEDSDYNESSAYAGVGVRYEFYRVYADLSVDVFRLDTDADYNRYLQSAVTLGYKF